MDNAILTNPKGACARGIHGGDKAPHANTCAPRKNSGKTTASERHLAARLADYEKTVQHSDVGRGLKLQKPGSQNRRNG